MEEIKAGDYIRTYTGKILKVRTKIAHYICTENWLGKNQFTIEEIKKNSPNIIDLIEINDICITRHKAFEELYYEHIKNNEQLEILKNFFKEESLILKGIITKEQINQVKYEV